jgi:hypothetical protein
MVPQLADCRHTDVVQPLLSEDRVADPVRTVPDTPVGLRSSGFPVVSFSITA